VDEVGRDSAAKDRRNTGVFSGTSSDNKDQAGLAYSADLIHWIELRRSGFARAPGQFDFARRTGVPRPRDRKGIVLIYNGAETSGLSNGRRDFRLKIRVISFAQ